MDRYKQLEIAYGSAICYSGYRKGQSPDTETHPTYSQIKEDLLILHGRWDYLRLYDCSLHAEIVLDIIQKEKLNFKVMLGAFIVAEMNNFGCPWGTIYSEKDLLLNRKKNLKNIEKLINLANRYPDIVFSTSAGNEATVEWTDHFVPVNNVIEYVRLLEKSGGKSGVWQRDAEKQ